MSEERLLLNEPPPPDAVDDLAVVLADEFAQWFRNLVAQGETLPRAFSGVTADGRQEVLVLSDLPFDHIQRRDFMIWVCQQEQFIGYVYGTRVAVYGGDSPDSEAMEIYASSARYDVNKTLGIEMQPDGTIRLFDQHYVLRPAGEGKGVYFGLQHKSLPREAEDFFRKFCVGLPLRLISRQR
jgi:hypothetical protein